MDRLCLRFHGEQDICPQGGTQSGHKCPQAHPTGILRRRTQGRGRHFGARAGGGSQNQPRQLQRRWAGPDLEGWPPC